jgi:site-specific recombinase XerD
VNPVVNHSRIDNLVPGTQFRGVLRPPVSLTDDEVAALLNQVGYRTRPRQFALRNKAFVVVLWRAGLRLSEALALVPHDLDLGSQPTIMVNKGKGGKQRAVGIDADTALVLRYWLETREQMGFPKSGPVFPRMDGEPLSARGAQMMIERAAKRAGITKRCTPHSLRHTYAVELVKEGVPMPFIQRALGHADLSVTSRYLITIAPGEVTERLNRREWSDRTKAVGAMPESKDLGPESALVTVTGDDDWYGGRAMVG